MRKQNKSMSMREPPLFIATTGYESIMNTRVLAIGPTSHPNAAATSEAVLVGKSNSRNGPITP
jgi:hypothetical protein